LLCKSTPYKGWRCGAYRLRLPSRHRLGSSCSLLRACCMDDFLRLQPAAIFWRGAGHGQCGAGPSSLRSTRQRLEARLDAFPRRENRTSQCRSVGAIARPQLRLRLLDVTAAHRLLVHHKRLGDQDVHLKAATRAACSMMTRELSSSVDPAGSPLTITLGPDQTGNRAQPPQLSL